MDDPSDSKAVDERREFLKRCGRFAAVTPPVRKRLMPRQSDMGTKSVELGKDDAVALTFGGFGLAYVAGDLDRGTTGGQE